MLCEAIDALLQLQKSDRVVLLLRYYSVGGYCCQRRPCIGASCKNNLSDSLKCITILSSGIKKQEHLSDSDLIRCHGRTCLDSNNRPWTTNNYIGHSICNFGQSLLCKPALLYSKINEHLSFSQLLHVLEQVIAKGMIVIHVQGIIHCELAADMAFSICDMLTLLTMSAL